MEMAVDECYGVCLKKKALFHQLNRGLYQDIEAGRYDKKSPIILKSIKLIKKRNRGRQV